MSSDEDPSPVRHSITSSTPVKHKRGRPPWRKAITDTPQKPPDRSRSRDKDETPRIATSRGRRGRPPKVTTNTDGQVRKTVTPEESMPTPRHHRVKQQQRKAVEESEEEDVTEQQVSEEEVEERKKVSSRETGKTLSEDCKDDFEVGESEEEEKAPKRKGRLRKQEVQEELEGSDLAGGSAGLDSELTNESKSQVNQQKIKKGGAQRVLKKQQQQNADPNALEIDLDIEEDTQRKVQQEKVQVDIARQRNPALFRIYDERCQLKFKNPIYLKQQALKKQASTLSATGNAAKSNHHLFKHLKQILLNFDPSEESKQQTLIQNQQNPEAPTFNSQLGSYMSIDSGISVRLPSKYCDFTGFHGKYKHKINGLRFTDETHYHQIDKMQNSKVEEIISCRKNVAMFKMT